MENKVRKKIDSSKIPSFSSLLAFESAATFLSFSKAANHLGRTRSAISHAVADIELRFQCRLFNRKGKSLELTPEGARYLKEIREALATLEKGSQLFSKTQPRKEYLEIQVTPLFLHVVLLPRVDECKALIDDLELNIKMSGTPSNWEFNSPDLEIRLDDIHHPTLEIHDLGTIPFVPVCTPDLANGVNPIRDISDLKYHTLVHDMHRTMDWPNWLENNGFTNLDPKNYLAISDPKAIINVVQQSLGVSFCAYPIFKKRSCLYNSLILPFPDTAPQEWKYKAVFTKENNKREEIEQLIEWFRHAFHEAINN